MKRGPVIGFLLLMVLAWPKIAQENYKPPEVAAAGDTYGTDVRHYAR